MCLIKCSDFIDILFYPGILIFSGRCTFGNSEYIIRGIWYNIFFNVTYLTFSCFSTTKNIQNMKDHKINQTSVNTFDTKSSRNRHVTVRNPDPIAPFCGRRNGDFCYSFKLTAPLSNRPNGFCHRILTHTVRCGFDGIFSVRFGAVEINQESYGAGWCGFQTL